MIQKVSVWTKAFRLFFLLALTSVVGYVGSTFVTPSSLAWYDTLIVSSVNPPNTWFGVAWGILYILMAVAAWMVWGRVSPRYFVLQLAFNLLWTFLFFYLKNPIMGLIDIAVMIVFIILTIIQFWKQSRIAGGLMIPVLLWSSFAFYLNLITVLYNTRVGIWLGLI
ncbi:MAG: tryptophan-rich sensory protein [Alphaproteobacteria bacterium]|nr:tryptophan-rich sensory protein [Alphaproteobacteria bacterium]